MNQFIVKSVLRKFLVFSLCFMLVPSLVQSQSLSLEDFVIFSHGNGCSNEAVKIEKDVTVNSGNVGSNKSIEVDKNFQSNANVYSDKKIEFNKNATINGSIYAAEDFWFAYSLETDKYFDLTGDIYSGSHVKVKSGTVDGD